MQSLLMKLLQESFHLLHLPIIEGSWKTGIPTPLNQRVPNIHHPRFLINRQSKQGREWHTQRGIPAPSIPPNLALRPLPTRNKILEPTKSQSILIPFQSRTPCTSLTSQEHHPPLSSPYFPLITWFHKVSLSLAKRQFHLQRRALLRLDRHLTPKPPFSLLKHTNSHLTNLETRG